MPLRTITVGEHTIGIKAASWNGKETIYYDGEVVSEKIAPLGTSHYFTRLEDGENIHYEVQIGANPSKLFLAAYVTVRRNGRVIYSDR